MPRACEAILNDAFSLGVIMMVAGIAIGFFWGWMIGKIQKSGSDISL